MHESKKKCIGIDVGGTTVKIGLFETDGTLLFKWEVPTRKEEGGRYILEDVAASIREVLTEKEIHFSDILGCRLGIPGPVMPGRLCRGLREPGMAGCEPAERTECHAGSIFR